VIAHADISLALGFARTAAFAAAMPLGRTRAVPRIVRVMIALCLAPAAASVQQTDSANLRDWSELTGAAIAAAAQGAAIGLCATIVAGAAAVRPRCSVDPSEAVSGALPSGGRRPGALRLAFPPMPVV